MLAFLSLSVIPSLKITDRGLVDVERFELGLSWQESLTASAGRGHRKTPRRHCSTLGDGEPPCAASRAGRPGRP
jgi:hypothetical protein